MQVTPVAMISQYKSLRYFKNIFILVQLESCASSLMHCNPNQWCLFFFGMRINSNIQLMKLYCCSRDSYHLIYVKTGYLKMLGPKLLFLGTCLFPEKELKIEFSSHITEFSKYVVAFSNKTHKSNSIMNWLRWPHEHKCLTDFLYGLIMGCM